MEQKPRLTEQIVLRPACALSLWRASANGEFVFILAENAHTHEAETLQRERAVDDSAMQQVL